MDTQFTKRLKSLLWRSAMMAITFAIVKIAEGVSGLGLSTQATALITTILGLINGEISKHLNTPQK